MVGAFRLPERRGFVMAVPVGAETPVLNSSHRCDRCGSQAYVRVMFKISLHLPEGGMLLLCNHHWQANKYGLSNHIEHLTDETHRLAVHVKDDKHVTPGQIGRP